MNNIYMSPIRLGFPGHSDDMTKLYGYDRNDDGIMLIKGYIESTQSRIVIVIYKHIAMYINIYKF